MNGPAIRLIVPLIMKPAQGEAAVNIRNVRRNWVGRGTAVSLINVWNS
jgi:hypothetical protein